MAYPPAHLMCNAAKTHLESRSTTPRHLYFYRPPGFTMVPALHSYGSYNYYPASGLSWADAHSGWVGQTASASWSTASSTWPADPTLFYATRIVGYLNDPLQNSYNSAFQQSVRVLFGNIVSMRFDLPTDVLPYKDSIVGFEVRLRTGAGTALTTFQATASDYVVSYVEAGPSNLPIAVRMSVTASRPSYPINVLQDTSFQTNLYSLQAASAAQTSMITANGRVFLPATGPVFQSVSSWQSTSTPLSTLIAITPPAGVQTSFAGIIDGSSTGSVWISVALTEDYVYPTAMRTNLFSYLGFIEVFAKF